jgi:hypothetical protein
MLIEKIGEEFATDINPRGSVLEWLPSEKGDSIGKGEPAI